MLYSGEEVRIPIPDADTPTIGSDSCFLKKLGFIMNYVYIIAIALQVSGALLLIEKIDIRRSEIEKSVKDEETSQDGGELDEEGIKYVHDHKDVQKRAYKTFINNCAFGMIALGYALGIFGEVGNRWLTLFIVAVLVPLIVMGTKWKGRSWAEKRHRADVETIVKSTL